MKYLILFFSFVTACSHPKTKVNLAHELPPAPAPVGNYVTYRKTGNLIFINQIALNRGKVEKTGRINVEVTLEEAKKATRQTTLNIISVLKEAVDGDLSKVRKCVQISGYFNTDSNFTQHAEVLNEASKIIVDIFGEAGKHTRGAFGAPSLPMGSPVEIQAIFEVW